MATGLSNKLAGQTGEYLVCAELGRRGLIATTFTGNVPEYDLLVCDDALNTVPIQVKTSRGDNWPSRADLWLDIEFDDEQKKQINLGNRKIDHPDLIYVCVALGTQQGSDQFFICRKSDIQAACIGSYTRWMDPKDWKRPRNYKSLDNRYTTSDLQPFENNWSLISDQLDQQKASILCPSTKKSTSRTKSATTSPNTDGSLLKATIPTMILHDLTARSTSVRRSPQLEKCMRSHPRPRIHAIAWKIKIACDRIANTLRP